MHENSTKIRNSFSSPFLSHFNKTSRVWISTERHVCYIT